MPIKKLIIHDPPGGISEKTYEYVLPVASSDFRFEHQRLLTPWFWRYFDCSPTEVRSLLTSDWSVFSADATIKFRDYLLSLTPKSIVIDRDRIWLSLHSESNCNSIMIHEPRTLTEAQTSFVEGFQVDALDVFCRHFFEAYEGVTPYTNAIAMDPGPVSNDSFAKSKDWLNGIFLYYIGCGDVILMAPDGRIGRWNHEIGWSRRDSSDCAVKEIAPSFNEFLDHYLGYLKMSWEDQRGTPFW